jgi:hypothetical protein
MVDSLHPEAWVVIGLILLAFTIVGLVWYLRKKDE